MDTIYAVLGSGMQGTAAAYDLAKFSTSPIYLADLELERAAAAALRVNSLIGREACTPIAVNVLDRAELLDFLTGCDVALSCVPYWMHPQIVEVAIAAKAHICDLGGNTEITWQTLGMDAAAKAAGVSVVPDCGLAPGLVNSIGLFLLEKMDRCETIKLYCGVLPQNPQPPFNYKLTFNVEGLVTEYDYRASVLRNGALTEIDTLSELETLEIPGLGEMEAFTTSGGSSTAAHTLQGRVTNYDYKTIRFPGHCERMRIFKDFGFWREDSIDVKGTQVRPKDVFCRVFGESLGRVVDQDQCVIRGIGQGFENGTSVEYQLDIHDLQDAQTGFTSMERLTGFSLAIYAQAIAEGETPLGCVRYEEAMSGASFMDEIEKRGIRYSLTRHVT